MQEIGNNYSRYLDRTHMLIATSEDGEIFNSMYTILSENPRKGTEGIHKENGYHYPCCYLEGNRMFIVYSVNKKRILK